MLDLPYQQQYQDILELFHQNTFLRYRQSEYFEILLEQRFQHHPIELKAAKQWHRKGLFGKLAKRLTHNRDRHMLPKGQVTCVKDFGCNQPGFVFPKEI